jgi:hypothetical protein
VLLAVGLGAGYLLKGGSSTPPAAPATPSAPATSSAPAVPAPKDVAAATATVFIASEPKGAAIVVNGAPTGKTTPAQIPIARGGPAAVELTLKGYQRVEASLTDADLSAGTKEFKLVRESGPVRLTVSATYPFELVQGGKVISPSARQHQLTVSPGGATIRARNSEYLVDVPVAVDYQRSQIEATLPALGSVTVFSAVETCSVIIDGQDLGFPPIPRKQIAVGTHTVTLKCQDGRGDSQRVAVTASEAAAVRFGPPKTPERHP